MLRPFLSLTEMVTEGIIPREILANEAFILRCSVFID